jgi:protein-S-isoprenylcysteine O-methyltransferase Ste14
MRIPPPVLFLLTALAMIAVAVLWPGPTLLVPALRPLGWIVVLAGLGLAGAAVARLRRAGTTLRPDRDPSRLVTDGPWAFGRNPIYLGLTLILVGGALFTGATLPLIVACAFPVAIDRLQIPLEEAALARLFGAEWDAYRTRVRRWL